MRTVLSLRGFHLLKPSRSLSAAQKAIRFSKVRIDGMIAFAEMPMEAKSNVQIVFRNGDARCGLLLVRIASQPVRQLQ